MTIFVALISQKGGVGKSTLARAIAREYAASDWNVKIADLNYEQATSFYWGNRRMKNQILPEIPVQTYTNLSSVLKDTRNQDIVLLDAPPHSSKKTVEIAKMSHCIVIPTGVSLDDLEPTVNLALELVQKKIERKKICFVFPKVGVSDSENQEALTYLQKTNFKVIEEMVPFKPSFSTAFDLGYSLTEVKYKTLQQKADALLQSLVDQINKLTN